MSNLRPSNNGYDRKPHFVLVPLMAQGHTIPMIDMAHLLASHGAIVTFITTPANAARIATIIDRVKLSRLPITFVPLPFPAGEAGLPVGSENIDMLSSRDQLKNFLDAVCMLRDPLIHYLRAHGDRMPLPTCIISDNVHYWTRDVAREFGIPRILFHGFGCFTLLCSRNIRTKEIDENEPFVVPGLPDEVVFTKAQVPPFFGLPSMANHRAGIREAALAADGIVVNSFDDLEPSYREWYQNTVGKKVLTIGPLSLSNRNVADMAVRGNKASIDEDRCLRWLDSMKPSSVVYVSFGSLVRINPSQLVEIGSGLEASDCPFIWVIKCSDQEFEEWLSEFEDRTRQRGLIIRGWAPQVMILSHIAVGGFMMHCGWNSTLESVSAGVTMITWPHFGDQFLNEKLIVDVLKIGTAIGVKAVTTWGEENCDVLVKKDGIEKAIRSLFEGGEKAEERRNRLIVLGRKAKEAVEEGGSSFENVRHLIQHMNNFL